jgi:hypothetical protein
LRPRKEPNMAAGLHENAQGGASRGGEEGENARARTPQSAIGRVRPLVALLLR